MADGVVAVEWPARLTRTGECALSSNWRGERGSLPKYPSRLQVAETLDGAVERRSCLREFIGDDGRLQAGCVLRMVATNFSMSRPKSGS